MKKFVSAVAVLALVAFAAPALAATNPFMDVPMNHWAYDAIGQLAAHGILSGYPDGTYKGKQPTTRYEMASALARALAVVDMTKASRQDVEMLQKLVVEFHDELEALGVRVDEFEGKVYKLDERLGGWYIHGRLRLDYLYNTVYDDGEGEKGTTRASNFRIWMERFFGEDEQYHFVARIDRNAARGDSDNRIRFTHFYVDAPFFYDTTLTVGRFNWDLEGAYKLDWFGDIGEHGLGSVITDREVQGIGITKQFGLGEVRAFLAHHDNVNAGSFLGRSTTGNDSTGASANVSAWDALLWAKLQFNEQFGMDLAANYWAGDNAQPTAAALADDVRSLDSIFNAMAGLHFDFNEAINFNAVYHYQKYKGDYYDTATTGWYDVDADNTSYWKVGFKFDQSLLKFTGLALEYGQVKKGFVATSGQGAFFVEANGVEDGGVSGRIGTAMPDDLKFWRVALKQDWNEKWSSHEFYYGYDFDNDAGSDLKSEIGVGIDYRYSPQMAFGLQYTNVKYDANGADNDNVIRFRTQVVF